MTRQEFYNTKAWKQNRVAYAISKHCICERCGRAVYVSSVNSYLPKDKRLRYIVHHKEYLDDNNFTTDLAFDWNNLELLCIDCHNKEHYEQPTKDDVVFDEMGNLVKKIVVGRKGDEKNPAHMPVVKNTVG